jgi:hypothetical protein
MKEVGIRDDVRPLALTPMTGRMDDAPECVDDDDSFDVGLMNTLSLRDDQDEDGNTIRGFGVTGEWGEGV